MADQSFREIQLGGKQLVFLFMCAVVLTVVVFLLGVSVGRDMRAVSAPPASQAAASTTTAGLPAAAVEPPPAASTSAATELNYPQVLKGQDPSKAPPPSPISEQPPAETSRPEPRGHAADAPKATKSEPPPAPAPPPVAPAAATTSKPATAASGWVVQVEAFSGSDVANREAAKLQARGYPAFVFTEGASTPGPRYKVRVGPYPARGDADRMLKALAGEGYKPLLKR